MYSGTKQKDGHHTFRRFSCTVGPSRKMVIIHLGGFHVQWEPSRKMVIIHLGGFHVQWDQAERWSSYI